MTGKLTNKITALNAELLILIFAVTFLVVLMSPHLSHEIWGDEAYTLLRYASSGFLYPFTDYHNPNNHLLFSALLSLYWFPEIEVVYLRVPLLMLYGFSLLSIYFLTKYASDRIAAIFCLVMYGSSWVVQSFSLELRGYAFSLALTILLLACSISILCKPSKFGLFLYPIISWICIWTIPTNLLVISVISIWLFFSIWRRDDYSRHPWGTYLSILIAPLFSLAIFIPLASQMAANSQYSWSSWERINILTHFWSVTVVPVVPLIPIILIGAFKASKASEPKELNLVLKGSEVWSLLLVLIVLSIGFVFLLPKSPFPRNLIPLLPVIIFVFGYFAARGLKTVGEWAGLKAHLTSTSILLCLIMFGISNLIYDCHSTSYYSMQTNNLCYQHYHDQYSPNEVVDLLAGKGIESPALVFVDRISEPEIYYSALNRKIKIRVLPMSQIKFKIKDQGNKFLVLNKSLDLSNELKRANLSTITLTPLGETKTQKIYQVIN